MAQSDSKKRLADSLDPKTFRENAEKTGRSALDNRRKKYWAYQDLLKKAEELEIELKTTKAEIKKQEEKWPDLLQAKGCEERMFRLEHWVVQKPNGELQYMVADTLEDAKERLLKELEKKAKEKQAKSEKKAKKKRMDNSES